MTESMEHAAYNRLVQDMQAFCLSAGLAHRITADAALKLSTFEVYYGNWWVLGVETNPMTPRCVRSYDQAMDARIRYTLVKDLCA